MKLAKELERPILYRPAAIKLSDNNIIDSGKLNACGSYNDLIANK